MTGSTTRILQLRLIGDSPKLHLPFTFALFTLFTMLRFLSSTIIASFARSQASRDDIVNPEECAVYQEEVPDQKEVVEEVHQEQFSQADTQ